MRYGYRVGDVARVRIVFDDQSDLTAFTSVSIRRAYTDPLDHVSIEAAPRVEDGTYKAYREKLGKGERVTLFVNDVLQGDYLVTTADITSSKDKGTRIKATLKNLLVTPFEGDVDPDISIGPAVGGSTLGGGGSTSGGDTPIGVFLLKVFKPYGFATVVNNAFANTSAQSGKPLKAGAATTLVPLGTLKQSEATAHEGETAYKFASRITSRLGFAIHLTAQNEILVDAPDYTTDPIGTVVAISNSGAFYPDADYAHGDIHVHETNDHQFSECEVRGQRSTQSLDQYTSAARPNSAVKADDVINSLSRYRSKWAPYKKKWMKDKSSSSNNHATTMACFELGMAAKDAYRIRLQVHGWTSKTGYLWQYNQQVRLVHELDGIDRTFWIEEVERVLDEHGEYTKLELIPQGALILGKP